MNEKTTLKIPPGSNGVSDWACSASESFPPPSTHLDCLTRAERIQYLRSLVLSEWNQFKDSTTDPSNLSKNELRRKHAANRLEILQRDRPWIASRAPKLLRWFANGSDLVPDKINPRLIQVESNEERSIFRLARYSWSLPYSKGYGRRLRFLVVDDHNDKLIGVLGLQSPPLDFRSRDKKFSFPPDRKVELVNQTMDIYVQGAVPPYNVLLGGKLVVMAAAAKEIREAYRTRYEGKLTQIEHKSFPAHLVAVTTTSATAFKVAMRSS